MYVLQKKKMVYNIFIVLPKYTHLYVYTKNLRVYIFKKA